MTKQVVVKEGVETVFTFVSPKSGNVFAILADGTRYGKSLTRRQWTFIGKHKAELTIEQWIKNWTERRDSLPTWAHGVHSIPTMRQLEKWSNDGIARTVDGQRIEPDGTAANGAPSWLIVLGML
jgi:hypothetical protein